MFRKPLLPSPLVSDHCRWHVMPPATRSMTIQDVLMEESQSPLLVVLGSRRCLFESWGLDFKLVYCMETKHHVTPRCFFGCCFGDLRWNGQLTPLGTCCLTTHRPNSQCEPQFPSRAFCRPGEDHTRPDLLHPFDIPGSFISSRPARPAPRAVATINLHNAVRHTRIQPKG